MTTELKVTVEQGDPATALIDWLDEDGRRHHTRIEANICPEKPDRLRTLRILINGKIVATATSWGTCYPTAELSDSGKAKQIDRLQKQNNDLSVKTAQQANLITRQNAEFACLKRNLRYDAEIVQNLHEIMANRLI